MNELDFNRENEELLKYIDRLKHDFGFFIDELIRPRPQKNVTPKKPEQSIKALQ